MVTDTTLMKIAAMAGITVITVVGVCMEHLDGVLIASAMSALAGIVGYTIGETQGIKKATK